MGFSDDVAKRVLSECAWDVNEAIDRLLASGAMASEVGGGGSSCNGVEASASLGGGPAAHRDTGPGEGGSRAGSTISPGGLNGGDSSSMSQSARVEPPAPTSKAQTTAAASAGTAVTTVAKALEEQDKEHEPQADQPQEAAQQQQQAKLQQQQQQQLQQQAKQQEPEEEAPPTAVAQAVAAPARQGPATEVAEVAAASNAEVPGPALEQTPTATVPEPVAEKKSAAASPAAPKKHIQRVQSTWAAKDPSQLSVVEGDFVNVWTETGTENGWIHADARSGDGASPGQVGWLPVGVLKKLPQDQQWMRVSQQWQAMDESQCSVEEGALVVVWRATRTSEGWAYAEAEKDGGIKPGWLPVFCLEWAED